MVVVNYFWLLLISISNFRDYIALLERKLGRLPKSSELAKMELRVSFRLFRTELVPLSIYAVGV